MAFPEQKSNYWHQQQLRDLCWSLDWQGWEIAKELQINLLDFFTVSWQLNIVIYLTFSCFKRQFILLTKSRFVNNYC